jgi:hypothetical protein
MIGADIGCALLLASVLAAATAGVLRIGQLYVVSLLFSMLVVGFAHPGAGGLLGALLAARMAGRFGLGRSWLPGW